MVSAMELPPALCQTTLLTIDSREVIPGAAFIAQAGEHHDGHDFIGDALRRGARVIVHEAGREVALERHRHPLVTLIPVADPRRFGREAAPAYHGHPGRELAVYGITGTNGKTTCSVVLERLLRGRGLNPGVINSLHIRYNETRLNLANILPEPVTLQRLMRTMVTEGVDALILEISSYALLAERVSGIDFDGAVLTNLTPDHLDVHGTMEAYLAAKLRLFDLLDASGKPARVGAWWQESAFASRIAAHAGRYHRTIFTIQEAGQGAAVLGAGKIRTTWDGTRFDLHLGKLMIGSYQTNLLGGFNVRNVLAALATQQDLLDDLARGRRAGHELLSAALVEVVVPGRLERIANDRGVTILVDYAHTEDALDQVLRTLRPLTQGWLITVFGCGGDRDRAKRPRMGRVAARWSDHVVLTSDNPRTEDPREIIRDIEGGIDRNEARCAVVVDRLEAIQEGLALARDGDILLVAGKGHETVQIVGREEHPFDDREVIRRLL